VDLKAYDVFYHGDAPFMKPAVLMENQPTFLWRKMDNYYINRDKRCHLVVQLRQSLEKLFNI